MTNKENAELFCKEWLEGKSTFSITTSGSTGTPKVIELRRDQMIASARKTIKALGLQHGMTALVCLDVNFIAGRMMLVRSLVAGMNMIVVEPKADPLEEISDVKIDFVALVPYQLTAILNSPHQLRNVDRVILGGAPISSQLLKDIQQLKTSCYATFGMTETITHVALQKLNGVDRQDYFETLEGVKVSADERGCLVIEVDYLDESVVTNDVVELIDSHKFRWLGRWDNVINSGGIKVFPEKVEKVVSEFFDVKGISNSLFLIGVPDEKLGQQVTLVVEGKISEKAESDLFDYLKRVLSKYEVPKKVLYTEKFIMTPTNKINRSLSLKAALTTK